MRQKVSSHFPFFLKAHCKTVLISCKLHCCKVMEIGIILLIDQVAAVFFVKNQKLMILAHLKPRLFKQFSRLICKSVNFWEHLSQISTNQNTRYNQAMYCDCLKFQKQVALLCSQKNLQSSISICKTTWP